MTNESLSICGFRQGLAERKIVACRCDDCGALFLPPRPICRSCHGRRMSLSSLSGRGKIIAVTPIRIVPAAMAAAGFGRDRPYWAGYVRTAEGPTIAARMDGGDVPLKVGDPVEATFVEQEDAGENEPNAMIVFRPAGTRRERE